MNEIQFYRNLNEETFDDESCFLCGFECDDSTDEHIFPKWLQHKYDLWDQKLEITNGTTIQYRRLTVPCCSKCNNEDLSRMEGEFQKLIDNSFENLRMEDEVTIFQWTAKILYATRYKELSLRVDRRSPDLGNILSPQDLEGYTSLHLFLQSIRYKTTFNEPKPWSLFILDCEDEDFFYHNNIAGLSFSMKFGKIAITIVYEDNNIISKFMGEFKNIRGFNLNFAQFLEVNCNIFYSALLKENVPRYLSSFNKLNEELIVNTSGTLRSRKWDKKEYAHYFDFLLQSCGINIGQSVLQENESATSFLIDDKGRHLTKQLFDGRSLTSGNEIID